MEKYDKMVVRIPNNAFGLNFETLNNFPNLEKWELDMKNKALILYFPKGFIPEHGFTFFFLTVPETTLILVYPEDKEKAQNFYFRKAHLGDSGTDVITRKPITIPAHGLTFIDTGYAYRGVEPPTPRTEILPFIYEVQVRSRSGLASKMIFVINSPGTIDAGYRGRIGILLANLADKDYTIPANKGVAQLMVAPVVPSTVHVMTKDDIRPLDTRGTGGFGSTDKENK